MVGSPVDKPLRLAELCDGLVGLTPTGGAWLAEAASVCFESQGHGDSCEMVVSGEWSVRQIVHRVPVTDQMKRSSADMQEATEYGACAVAILLVRSHTEMSVVERSYKGTGFDYWLGPQTDLPFQRAARLEVSGTLRASDVDVRARVKQKVEQTRVSDGESPA